MPRVPLVPADIDQPAELVAAIRARRGGELLALDRLLLHSPPLAAGWNAFLRSVRQELDEVSDKLRELAICAVAVLNGADYEFHQHAPLLQKAGATAAQLQALQDPAAAALDTALFDAAERAVLQFTVESTRQVRVAQATFDRARAELGSDRAVVELVGIIGAYNLVSRFLVALDLHP